MDIRPIVSRYDLWSPQVITTTSGSNFGKGQIDLEYGYQLVAVPVEFGYWNSELHTHIHDGVTVARFENYIYDQILDLYGSVVEVANTYTGDNQAFNSYVCGSTPTSSPHNFQLVYSDNGAKEIAGFWIKITGQEGPYTITWGS